MFDPTETPEKEPVMCESCQGMGYYDVGDLDDGIVDECPECQGTGFVEEGDIFIPKRDAFTPND